jgi:hypothetical protein
MCKIVLIHYSKDPVKGGGTSMTFTHCYGVFKVSSKQNKFGEYSSYVIEYVIVLRNKELTSGY